MEWQSLEGFFAHVHLQYSHLARFYGAAEKTSMNMEDMEEPLE